MLMTLSRYDTDEDRFDAIAARNSAADGAFYYGVLSTGVFCKPSCPSKHAKRENMRLFDTLEAADKSGLRPCKRCKPTGLDKEQEHAALVKKACDIIDGFETPPTLNALADKMGMSPHHFHRIFKSVTGLTPKGYADARRAENIRCNLSQETSVTDAIYDAGFGSSARFYEKADDMLGMSAKARKRRGKGEHIQYSFGECSLGTVVVAITPKGICAILIADTQEAALRELREQFANASLTAGNDDFGQSVESVIALIDGNSPVTELPLDIIGTIFQERVWQALREIPYGETRTYSEIADAIGSPKSVRAVANACGSNKLAVAVPCHRVVRKGGDLSGYRWGVERKKSLLDKEATSKPAGGPSDKA